MTLACMKVLCLNDSGIAQTSIEKSFWGNPVFIWAKINKKRWKRDKVWFQKIS